MLATCYLRLRSVIVVALAELFGLDPLVEHPRALLHVDYNSFNSAHLWDWDIFWL